MSNGYDGNPDAGSEMAQAAVDSAIKAAQGMLKGPVLNHCLDCGVDIDPRRVEVARKNGIKCTYCIDCQPFHDAAPAVRIFDNVL